MTSPTSSLSAYFTKQHREADAFWVALEAAEATKDAAQINGAFSRFDRSVRAHFLLEEEVLFPEFERATGMTDGPTAVMSAEHRQARALLDQMHSALDAADHDTLMDTGDTLMTFLQQHNMKEEGMLYRMSEHALADVWPALYERIQSTG